MRRTLLVSLLAAALVAVAAGPAGAGLAPVTYVFDPLSGPPGTVVSVSAAAGECLPSVNVGFFDSTFGIPQLVGSTTTLGDGSFSGSITIPLDAAPGSTRQIGAQCQGEATQYVLFQVDAAPGTTVPTTAPSTTAAAAATVQPAFTG